MRIYGLHDSLDKLCEREDFQIEIIGEDHCWTYVVSTRSWDDLLGRYNGEMICSGTTPSFLSAYDEIAKTINMHPQIDK